MAILLHFNEQVAKILVDLGLGPGGSEVRNRGQADKFATNDGPEEVIDSLGVHHTQPPGGRQKLKTIEQSEIPVTVIVERRTSSIGVARLSTELCGWRVANRLDSPLNLTKVFKRGAKPTLLAAEP
jgi:hypothetical protein